MKAEGTRKSCLKRILCCFLLLGYVTAFRKIVCLKFSLPEVRLVSQKVEISQILQSSVVLKSIPKTFKWERNM